MLPHPGAGGRAIPVEEINEIGIASQNFFYKCLRWLSRAADIAAVIAAVNGKVKMAARIWGMRSRMPVLAGRSKKALDRQPAQDGDLDALHKTGLGLGIEANLFVTLASHPLEAISHKFDPIRIAVDIASGLLRQTLREPRTIEEHTHLGVQFA